MSKFDALLQAGTNGANYDKSTEDIIAKLEAWDASHGIEVADVAPDRVTVKFSKLPDDLTQLGKDIYAFCPDVIDQHFGCMDEMDEMVEMVEMMGDAIKPELAELVDGVDFDDPEFGQVLLRRSLTRSKSVSLWWD